MVDTQYTNNVCKFKITQDGIHPVHQKGMQIQKNTEWQTLEYTNKLWKFKSTQDGRHSVHQE